MRVQSFVSLLEITLPKSWLPQIFIATSKSYFPDVVIDKPWRYELVTVPKTVALQDLLKVGAITAPQLAEYNPGLTKQVHKSEEVFSAGVALRVPWARPRISMRNLRKSPNNGILPHNKISKRYKANGKESLMAIADRHGVSAAT